MTCDAIAYEQEQDVYFCFLVICKLWTSFVLCGEFLVIFGTNKIMRMSRAMLLWYCIFTIPWSVMKLWHLDIYTLISASVYLASRIRQ